jgi:TRAP-type C4-dicarboxylate transport system permease large subunit
VGHFRMPSIDPGVVAVLWGLGLGVFIYFGLIAVGSTKASAFVLAAVAAVAIALFVRLRGADQ